MKKMCKLMALVIALMLAAMGCALAQDDLLSQIQKKARS